MRIKKFRVINYKSFVDSDTLDFNQGINVIVGKNNSGKTALLEALRMTITSKPHRSKTTKPRPTSPLNPNTEVYATLTASKEEIYDFCLSYNDKLGLPVPSNIQNPTSQDYKSTLDLLLKTPEIDFSYHASSKDGKALSWIADIAPTFNTYPMTIPNASSVQQIYFKANEDRTDFVFDQNIVIAGVGSELGMRIADQLRSKIYLFNAERLNIGTSRLGINKVLHSNANNLPEVLHLLQSNRSSAFNQYNQLVSKVFPDIKRIGTRPSSSNDVMIYVQTSEEEREDLNFDLSECGTGVGQVLAMLYFAFFEETPKTIIIDEPNSFLHPGATKTLLSILADFPQHQYIVSSHAPEVFKTSNTTSLKMISCVNGKSSVQEYDFNKVADSKSCLLELGVELSDYLCSDHAIWVEGPTEKECFPKILKVNKGWMDYQVSFLSIKNTGDFETPKSDLVIDLYHRMVNSNLLLPAKVEFVLDSENKSDIHKADLKRKGQGHVHFIGRRMFENYLLHPLAITSLLNSFDCFKVTNATPQQIEQWLIENGQKYCEVAIEPFSISDKIWLEKVNGAKLLSKLVADLTQATEVYRKIPHGIFLTDWLLSNSREYLNDLSDFLISLVTPKIT